MKVKSTTVRVRRRGGEGNKKASRPTTRVGTRGVNPCIVGGKPPSNGKPFLFIGLAAFFGIFLLVMIIVIVSGSKDRDAQHQPKSTAASTKSRSTRGGYGAKYAPNDPRMVMTEESEMAKARKKRRAESGR